MLRKIDVKLEGQKWYEWLLPWHFVSSSEIWEGNNVTITNKTHGICWLWWTFYFTAKT
jgi:hypothetical protein